MSYEAAESKGKGSKGRALDAIFDADTDYGSEAEEIEKKRKNGGVRVVNGASARRCGLCEGCRLTVDCGVCAACKTKAKLGGKGSAKQVCIKRRCQNLKRRPAPTASRANRGSQPQDTLLESLVQFIQDCGGDGDVIRSHWRVEVETRKGGATANKAETFFYNEQGRRFRSKNDVARSLGLDPPHRPVQMRRVSSK